MESGSRVVSDSYSPGKEHSEVHYFIDADNTWVWNLLSGDQDCDQDEDGGDNRKLHNEAGCNLVKGN